MQVVQPEQFGYVLVESGSQTVTDDVFTISNEDFIMLIDYYRYQKANGLKIF
jgi:hypothetical protein